MNYFNYEERNGLFLLCFLLVLFCTFIFIQKRMLPSEANLNIAMESGMQGEDYHSHQKSDYQEKNPSNKGKAFSQINTASLPSGSSSKVVSQNNNVKSQLKVNQKEDLSLKNSKTKHDGSNEISASSPRKNKKKDIRRIWNKESTAKKDQAQKYQYKRQASEPISINSKEAAEWKTLRGIGPTYAERIIKYQTWLGGFHSREQLKEVYGITDSLYQTFEHLLIEAKPYKKIKVNLASQDELGRHPYLYWKEAKRIIRYRKHHGDFSGLGDIAKIKGINQDQIKRLEPYLDFYPSIENSDLVELTEK